ncbi:hypothetical protein D9M71_645240 [compost metagenome]
MVAMLIISILAAIVIISRDGHDRNGQLMWVFGTMGVEVLVIFVTMTNYINHGVGAA